MLLTTNLRCLSKGPLSGHRLSEVEWPQMTPLSPREKEVPCLSAQASALCAFSYLILTITLGCGPAIASSPGLVPRREQWSADQV